MSIKRDPEDTFVSDIEKENDHTLLFPAGGKRYMMTKHYLGGGGFGAVYMAYEVVVKEDFYSIVPDKKYAVKQYINVQKSKFVENEIDMLTYLNKRNCNVVKYYGYARQNVKLQNIYYIVMEYVEGTTLLDITKRHPSIPLVDTLVNYLTKILKTLLCIHNAGIIHRDIKPDNIMIRPNNEIVFIDFGLGCVSNDADESDGMSRLQRCSGRAGTEGYVDPALQTGIEIKPLSDMYSLGATFYRIIVGTKPKKQIAETLKSAISALPDGEETDKNVLFEVLNGMLSLWKRPSANVALSFLEANDSSNEARVAFEQKWSYMVG